MDNNTSILEIRKAKFIENPNYDNYKKLSTKIDRNKEIFDNKFFAEVTEKVLLKKDIQGLLYISQLYVGLKRNVEAEYILFCAYKIDNANNEILHYLFDILCRRKQLGLVSSIGEKLDKSKNELMYVKSLIKYFILTRKKNDLDDLVKSYFERYKTDEEFVWFILIAAIQNDNYYYTYIVSKTNFQRELFGNLSGPEEKQIKNHFYKIINNLLIEKIYDIKNC
jgi:hypothetical protein